MRMKVLSASVVFLLAACDQGATQSAASTTPEVGVVTLKSEPVTLLTQLPGRTTAVKTAEVRPQVSGVIQKLLFTEGEKSKRASRCTKSILPVTKPLMTRRWQPGKTTR